MMKQKKSVAFKLVSICVILALLSPVSINAANGGVESRESRYLTSYSAYTYPAGGGKIEVYFDVTGVHYMDEIGALSIEIYESTNNGTWTYVHTFMHYETSGMLGHDDIYHSGHVTYQGTPGKYYRAHLCIWAGKDGGGDSRYLWTSGKLAT